MRMRKSPPYKREVSSRSSGAFPGTSESSKNRVSTSDLDSPNLGLKKSASSFYFDHDRPAVCADRSFHGKLVDVGLKVLFALPPVEIKTLPEISLTVEKADANQGDVQIGRAFYVISGKNPQAAGIDGQRLVQCRIQQRNMRLDAVAVLRRASRPRCDRLPGIPASGGMRS